MYQSNAYLRSNRQEELIIEDVGLVKSRDNKILVIGVYGAEKIVDAKIKEIDLLHHKVVLEKA